MSAVTPQADIREGEVIAHLGNEQAVPKDLIPDYPSSASRMVRPSPVAGEGWGGAVGGLEAYPLVKWAASVARR